MKPTAVTTRARPGALVAFALALCAALLLPATAGESDTAALRLGGDVYLTGVRPTHAEAGARALFAAGWSVRQTAAIAGSAHLAGRRVAVEAEVGGNLYAAAGDIWLRGPVFGDATLAAEEVAVAAAVGGNLRVMAARAQLSAPVAGAVLIAADEVVIEAPVAGDAAVAANRLRFGPGARIDGALILYEAEPGALEVPAEVAARIERRPLERRDAEAPAPLPGAPRARAAAAVASGILAVAVLAALGALAAPRGFARLRAVLAAQPFAALGWGFLLLSALAGAGVILALTLVGILFVPAAVLLALVTAATGYVVASWAIGAAVLTRFRRGEPDGFGERILAALLGALALGLLALVPVAGWLVALAAALGGSGALVLVLFRPAFFAA